MKKNKKTLNRRDALKLAGIGGTSMLLGTTQIHASATGPKKKPSKISPLRIVIIGGGMAGTILAYRLQRAITWPDITVFEPLRNSAWYQPGLTLTGTGIWCQKHIEYKREEFIPDGVTWKSTSVTSVDTAENKVVDAEGNETHYDYLIIATGAVLDYGQIEGLDGEIASLEMLEKKASWMDDPTIGSIYYFHGATELHEQFNTLVQKATETKDKKLAVFFTQQSVVIKSPGAAKSALFTLIDKLKEAGVRDRVDITVTSGDGKLSANEHYDKKYKKQLKKEGVTFEKAALSKVDIAAKTAMFDTGVSEQYDYLHITPSMKADTRLAENGLTGDDGWIEVNSSTLQHKRFENVFAVGDASGTSALKTGAAIVDQVKTVVNTIRSIDEGNKPTATYDGYGCDTIFCPEKKEVMLEAYDKSQKPLALFSFLDPLKCHSAYWYLQTRVIKPYVMYGVLRGWA